MKVNGKLKIYLIIPDGGKYNDIKQILIEEFEKFDHSIINIESLVGKNEDSKTTVHDRVNKSDLIIADISDSNPNVIYQVGFANSLNKSVVLISNQGFDIPFNIRGSRILIYDRDRLNDTLKKPIQQFLNSGNKEIGMASDANNRKKIFISYSHEDAEFMERLKIHLKPFEMNGSLDVWEDTKIKAGEKWEEKIKTTLDESVLAILLISADFLASDFIVNNELPPILENIESKGTQIIPLIVCPCRFIKHPILSKFQAINNPEVPLIKLSKPDREDIYVKLANRVEEALGIG